MNRRADRATAALGSLVLLAVAPGTVAGIVPWLITGWSSAHPPLALRVMGALSIAAGAAVLVSAFARFVIEGAGTPAPVAPTAKLVVGGLYRYVRNPMYLAVATVIVGQALLLGRWVLLVYALVFVAIVATFVRLYEEPVLTRRFGERYDEYRRAVPAWRPRARPWRPPDSAEYHSSRAWPRSSSSSCRS
jgi:protein-S-isoprenylcysteine O-methyltransferase Ste14